MATITTVISRPNPYVGPRPYRQGETIYGRERETSELLDLLIAERIILLYSASGAGKSSLLNAAILPKMADQGFQVFPTMRANLEPPTGVELGSNFNRYVYSCLQSIEEGLPENQRFSIEDLVKLKFKDYMVKYRERAQAQNPDQDNSAPILLVFDQAEEVIRILMTDRPKKLDFFVQLGELLRDRNIWALIAIREDYLASFDPYLRPIPTRLANRYRLTFLDADAAAKAIQSPARSVDVEFPDESARQLVDDLRAVNVQQPDGSTTQELGPTVEPVQLQVVCRRLWINLPTSEKTVTLEHVKALGNVNRALADYYALQTASIANMSHVPEREIREWFQRKLITASGIRGQVLMTPEKSDGLDNKAIWMLERAYLIRAEKRAGATWFELAHDRLVSPIRENNDEWFEKHLNLLQRRADSWNQQGRPDSMLLTGPEFIGMEVWVKNNTKIIISIEKDFYQKSKTAHQHAVRERTANILIRWLFVASVIATLVAIVAFFSAHLSQEIALARELGAASLSNLETDPERSVLLALEGLEVTTEPHPEIIQALHQALPAMRIVHTSSPQEGHLSKVYSVAYSPDGKFLASASKDGTIDIWDATDLTVIHTLTLVQDLSQYDGYGAFAAAYSPDGKSLAAVAADGKITVFDTSTWEIKKQFRGHTGQVRAVMYTHNGKYFVTGGGDSIVKVWDATTWKNIYSFGGKENNKDGNKDGIETLVFSLNDSTLFVGGDDDKNIYAWNMSTGQLGYKLTPPGDENTVINSIAISPNGKLLASAGSDRLIRLWNLDTKEAIMEIPGHVDWIWGLAFSIDGEKLISASADHTIRIWDTRYGRSQMVLNGPFAQVYGVAVSPDGHYVASASSDAYVRIWDISLQGTSEIITLDHESSVHDVLFSPDGKYIASDGANGVVNIWSASTGALIRKIHDKAFILAEKMSWSQDSRYLAVGYQSGQTVIWDMTAEKPNHVIPGNGSAVWAVSLNTENSLISVGDGNGIVHIYSRETWKEITKLDADKEFGWTKSGNYTKSDISVSAAIFSPDGKYLAASYYANGKIVIWDWKAKKVWMTLEGHDDIVENIVYNKDGNLLASASDDTTVILWDLLDPALTDHRKMTLIGHRALVYDVAFSPDEKLLISGGGDGMVKVWNRETGELVTDLYGNTNRIYAVAFSPDGKHIVSGSSDHSVRLYTLDTVELVRVAKGRITRPLNLVECQEFLHMTCQNFKGSDPLRPISDFFKWLFHW